jgi:hypothetical protein
MNGATWTLLAIALLALTGSLFVVKAVYKAIRRVNRSAAEWNSAGSRPLPARSR